MNLAGLDMIIKLGGAAITMKEELEVAKLMEIQHAAKLVKLLFSKNLKICVVHGAGSFGHHIAAEYGVSKGFPPRSRAADIQKIKEGFCKTRVSVSKLNHLVTKCFVEEGIPAVAVQPCGSWKTTGKIVTRDNLNTVTDLVMNGYVPVLHGDCVLDDQQGSNILSGDTIIMRLCEVFSPERVVFLTDVNGVYDRPPHQPGATLLQQIRVNKQGDMDIPVTTCVATHDVTGGMKLKLEAAISIVVHSQGRTPVFICNISSEDALNACINGAVSENATVLMYAAES